MLDLEKFTKENKVIVPIVAGWGQHKGRKIYAPNTEDGWYVVSMGDTASIDRKATLLEIEQALEKKKKLKVLALGTEGIPINFDNFFKKGLGEAINVWFLELPIFSVAEIIEWEDKRFYYYGQTRTKSQKVIESVKEAFERKQSLLGLRGITPELRYYFLLASLQRQSYEAVCTATNEYGHLGGLTELNKRISKFQSDFPTRLESTIIMAGGKLTKFSKRGKNYLVEWIVGGQTVKSTIRDNMQIISAGFCLSGDDKNHTLGSLVGLAQMFQDENPLYITRD